MGFDKRGDKLNKGEDMGLDQHAHLRGHKVDWEKYYSLNEKESEKEHESVFVWRKHARLQEFMAKKWADQNPSVKVEGHLSTSRFQWRSRGTMLYDSRGR